MKYEIGLDVVDVKDFSNRIKRSPLMIKNLFSREEIDYCKNNAIKLAGKFAAKEALIKSIKNFSVPIDWKSITILNKPNGEPFIQLGKKLTEQYKIKEIKVSISHNHSMAIAFVILIIR